MFIAAEDSPKGDSNVPDLQPDTPLPLACLADIVDSLDWAELLDALVSDFALALANGEAQYMQGVGDLMGRIGQE